MTRSAVPCTPRFGALCLFLALFGVLASAPGRAAAEEDAGDERKRALALEVMEVTGATAYGEEVARGLVAPLRPYFPTVSEELWKELAARFDVGEIVELSIPIYTRNFDEQELAELVEFYRSPLGRKVIDRMPIVMQESMVAFNRWNEEKLHEAIETLKQKGHEPVDLPPLPPRSEEP